MRGEIHRRRGLIGPHNADLVRKCHQAGNVIGSQIARVGGRQLEWAAPGAVRRTRSVHIDGLTLGPGCPQAACAVLVKRHGFAGGPKTHGQSDRHRAVGSRGAGTTPGHTWPGARAPGHMGNERVTVQNLKVALVDAERNLIAVRGAIPGSRNGLVLVRDAVKKPPKQA